MARPKLQRGPLLRQPVQATLQLVRDSAPSRVCSFETPAPVILRLMTVQWHLPSPGLGFHQEAH